MAVGHMSLQTPKNPDAPEELYCKAWPFSSAPAQSALLNSGGE